MEHSSKQRPSCYGLLWKDFLRSKRTSTNSGNCILQDAWQGHNYEKNFDNQNKSVFSVFIGKLIPTVYAEDAKTNMTDKITSRVPQLHISDDDVETYLANETGRDRIREMFTRKEKEFSPEVQLAVDVTQACMVLSFVVYSFFGGIRAREEFIINHKHTKFPTRFKAMRSYNDAIVLGGAKFGAIWAVKTGVFTATFICASQAIAVYRNKSSPFEYIAAGALTGSLMRINLGLRGLVAGAIIGGVFGTLGGTLMYGALRLSNETQEQRHYWSIHHRIKAVKQAKLLSGQGSPLDQIETGCHDTS